MIIQWSNTAISNLEGITGYLFINNEDAAFKLRDTIIEQVKFLAANSLIGPKLSPRYRVWYALKGQYKNFYKVLGADGIRIVMIRHSKRKPPTPEEIRTADRR